MRRVRIPVSTLAAGVVIIGTATAALAQTSYPLPGLAVETSPVQGRRAKTQPSAASAPRPATPVGASEATTPGPLEAARTASEGAVSGQDLARPPTFRTGEVLEAVPGLVVTQHSGEGKANQYFLRGFNLDHGTDLAITYDGMPVNMRSHGHGQGYTDTGFIIPELLQSLSYRKGPYFAAEGDFASAGAIHLDAADTLARNFAQVEVGSFGHWRAVTAAATPVGNTGRMLAAGEIVRFDGPWERPDDLRKLNGFLRYATGSRDNGFALTGMAYTGSWYATDQVPRRAVDAGLVGRYGTLDPTDGGNAMRYSLSGRWAQTDAQSATRVNLFAIRSDLALYNNFTYFLDDPVNGDQFKQTDKRVVVGGAASRTSFGSLGGLKSDVTIGVQTRYDSIDVGLFQTAQRNILSTVRDDRVEQVSLGVFGEHGLRWTPWLRTTLGARADAYLARVASNLPANSGADTAGLVSPKFGVVLGPWSKTEIYVNAGTGFHSNDARGTVTTRDPRSGAAVDPTPFLARSRGAEVGIRSTPVRGLTTTLAAFVLDFDSEIVFVGDAGTTEAARPSRRIGLEYTLRAPLTSWLSVDVEAAYTQARFTVDDPVVSGRYIPGAPEAVVSAGVSFENLWGGWFGSAKVRYFGPRPLIEDNSVRSRARTPVSARIGYAFADGLTVRLDAFNILDERSNQIDYFYASRLAAEPAAVDDVHGHPTEPRSFRLSVRKQF